MRQAKAEGDKKKPRPRERITRGYSDLPKEDPKSSESDSQSEEGSQEPSQKQSPKVKKIHHMTLKAMQRKKKLAEKAQKVEQSEQEQKSVVEKLPARRRGRPRGSRKIQKQDREDYQVNMEEESPQVDNQQELMRQKSEINLRKRQRKAKKMAEKSSEDNQKQAKNLEENVKLKPVEVTINIPTSKPSQNLTIPIIISPAVPAASEASAALAAPSAPKKRGRKKKVQPQEPIVEVITTAPAPQNVKIYTVPKAQTYNNYHKYYDKIMEETKQSQKPEIPLIFDRFSDPQAYKKFLADLL